MNFSLRKNWKTLCSILICIFFWFPSSSPSYGSDTQESSINEWPQIALLETPALKYLAQENFINGGTEPSSDPFHLITRAELIKIVILASDKDIRKECTKTSDGNNFSDVSSFAWYAPYLCEAKFRNIIRGYSDGSFHPYDWVNLATASKVIAQTFFPETEKIQNSVWFEPFVEKLLQEKLIPSHFLNSGSFFDNLTLSDIAQMIYTLKTKEIIEKIPVLTFSEFAEKQSHQTCIWENNFKKIGDIWQNANQDTCSCLSQNKFVCKSEFRCTENIMLFNTTSDDRSHLIFLHNNIEMQEENGAYTAYDHMNCQGNTINLQFRSGDAAVASLGEINFDGTQTWKKVCRITTYIGGELLYLKESSSISQAECEELEGTKLKEVDAEDRKHL